VPNQHTTKGKPKRTKVVSVRYTPPEHQAVSERAARKSQGVSEYIRDKSLEDGADATRGKGEKR
jgi:hypothetical protein